LYLLAPTARLRDRTQHARHTGARASLPIHTARRRHNSTGELRRGGVAGSTVNRIIISNVFRLPQTVADSIHIARRDST